MKKIINKCWILFLLFFSFCGNKKEEEAEKVTIPPPPPSIIVGIGKVLPENGLSLLSLNSSNKVIKVFKKEGDYVNKGEVIFQLEDVNESIDLEKAKANLNTQQISSNIDDLEVSKSQLKLDELWNTFQTSKRLLVKNAETQETVTKDSIAYREQLIIVEQQRKELSVKRSQINEQQIVVKDSKNQLQQQNYTALESGILTKLYVNIGQILSANEYFGELAPDGNWVVEGEVDELYATELRVGLPVEIVLIGQTTKLALGEINSVSPILQNKSIMYETIGEASDRRVRRFTVKINTKEGELLINQKVECKINLK